MHTTTRTLTLSLGVIAGADMTYLNGQLLGSNPAESCGRHNCTPGGNTLGTRLYITPRAYAVPVGLLNPPGGAPNVLAVRVLSYGGAGRGPANATNMSAAGSFPPFGTHPQLVACGQTLGRAALKRGKRARWCTPLAFHKGVSGSGDTPAVVPVCVCVGRGERWRPCWKPRSAWPM